MSAVEYVVCIKKLTTAAITTAILARRVPFFSPELLLCFLVAITPSDANELNFWYFMLAGRSSLLTQSTVSYSSQSKDGLSRLLMLYLFALQTATEAVSVRKNMKYNIFKPQHNE